MGLISENGLRYKASVFFQQLEIWNASLHICIHMLQLKHQWNVQNTEHCLVLFPQYLIYSWRIIRDSMNESMNMDAVIDVKINRK